MKTEKTSPLFTSVSDAVRSVPASACRVKQNILECGMWNKSTPKFFLNRVEKDIISSVFCSEIPMIAMTSINSLWIETLVFIIFVTGFYYLWFDTIIFIV